MFKSYNEDKIYEAYINNRSNPDVRDKWMIGCGNSPKLATEAYDRYTTKRGKEAVEEIHRYIINLKKKLYPGSSYDALANMILSGKFDNKLVICYNTDYRNNYIDSQTINGGKLGTLAISVGREFDRKAPSDYTKILPWVYENFEDIFVVMHRPQGEYLQELEELFKKTYTQVFDENGEVLMCGREKCMDLIDICNELDYNSNYGNEKTGMMNIESIKELYQIII